MQHSQIQGGRRHRAQRSAPSKRAPSRRGWDFDEAIALVAMGDLLLCAGRGAAAAGAPMRDEGDVARVRQQGAGPSLPSLAAPVRVYVCIQDSHYRRGEICAFRPR